MEAKSENDVIAVETARLVDTLDMPMDDFADKAQENITKIISSLKDDLPPDTARAAILILGMAFIELIERQRKPTALDTIDIAVGNIQNIWFRVIPLVMLNLEARGGPLQKLH